MELDDIVQSAVEAALSAASGASSATIRSDALREAADAYPALTRDMVSRGSVRRWLLELAETPASEDRPTPDDVDVATARLQRSRPQPLT